MIKINLTKALKTLKAQKIQDLKEARNLACDAGLNYNGRVFNLKDTTTENIKLKSSCSASKKYKYKFFDKDHLVTDFIDSAGFNAFRDAMLDAKDNIMVYYNEKYYEIMSCDDLEIVNNIVIDFNEA